MSKKCSKNYLLPLLRTPTFLRACVFNKFSSFSSAEKNFNWYGNFPLLSFLIILCTFETVISFFSNILGWWFNSNISFASRKTLLGFSENLIFFLVMAHSLLHYLYLLQLQFLKVDREEIFVLASNFYCHHHHHYHHHHFHHHHHQEVTAMRLVAETEEAKKEEGYYYYYYYYFYYY